MYHYLCLLLFRRFIPAISTIEKTNKPSATIMMEANEEPAMNKVYWLFYSSMVRRGWSPSYIVDQIRPSKGEAKKHSTAICLLLGCSANYL